MPFREFQIDFEGLPVHCYEAGSGFPILLLHGSGAGTSSTSNWALVMDDLAQRYHVFAADLIGFGLSARKINAPYFDIELWTRQTQFLLDRFTGSDAAGVIGHSLSGFLALRLAANNIRVVKVAVTGSPGTAFALTQALGAAWSFPNSVQELRDMYTYVVADPSALTDNFYESRLELLNTPGYAAYFSAMFAGDKQVYVDQMVLTRSELASIRAQVLFIHGIEDQVVPFTQATLPLMRLIKNADAALFGGCGHGPALEQPEKFMHAITGLFG